jgi:hypothetical protein
MIDPFDPKAEYQFFGNHASRNPMLCPHCGKQGYKFDEYEGEWGSNRWHDAFYLCASCQQEWVMRTYRYSGYEKYPGPAKALIYIPTHTAKAE